VTWGCTWSWRAAIRNERREALLRARGQSRGLSLLEEFVEGVTSVVGIPRSRGTGVRRRRRRGRRHTCGAVARDGYAGREQGALISLILHRNSYRNWLEALESGGWLEVRTLFAAVQIRVAFRASASQIGTRRQRGRAVEAARSRNMLHEAGEPGAGHVQGRTRALGFGAFAKTFVLTRVHVPVLSVFTIAVHGDGYSVACVWGNKKNV
jgi:hypothetical protein